MPGLGELYDARDHEYGRDVSLTVVRTDFAGDPDRLERFQRDASSAARLDHPRILTVHNVGADAQAAYIISEPIQGRTLREVRAGGPIPPGAGAPFVPQIAEALAVAHEKGVVHGNLTPDHILFTAEGVKVIGFGLAAATGNAEATVSGDLAAFDAISEVLTGPRVEAVSGRGWPGVAAAVGVIVFAGLIGMWLFGGDDRPASAEPEAVASEPVITEPDPTAGQTESRLKPAPTTPEITPAPTTPEVTPAPTAARAPSRPSPVRRAPARTEPPSKPQPAPTAPVPLAPPSRFPSGPSRLVWLDRTGAELGRLGDAADYGNVAFSPDGMRVAVTIRELEVCCANDIWTIGTSNGSRMRLTSTPGLKRGVVWSPDGSRVAFASAPAGSWDIHETSSDGAGVVRPLIATPRDEVSWDWVSTGLLLYAGDRMGRPQGAHQDLWARRIPGGRPFTYLRSVHRASLPSLSPDGRWVAFTLRPAGAERSDLYVARFPKYDGRRRVSAAGAQWPRWRGNTIFYVDTEQRLVSVPVSFRGSQVELSPANRVGDLLVKHGVGYSYDVSPDGERILVNTAASEDAGTLSRLTP